jgi:hypothetical protein
MTAKGLGKYFIFSRAAHQRSEGTMRSINSNRNLGNLQAQASAKSIVRRDADRPSMLPMWCASKGYASRLRYAVREQLQHFTTATRVLVTHVTGGALLAVAPQRSGRHSSLCRHAAR